MPFLVGLRKAFVHRPVVSTRPGKGRLPLGEHLLALSDSLDRSAVADLESRALQAELAEYGGSSLVYLDTGELSGEDPVGALERWARERLRQVNAPLELRVSEEASEPFEPRLDQAAARVLALFEEFLSLSGFCRGLQGMAVEARVRDGVLHLAFEILGPCVSRKILQLEERGFGIILGNIASLDGIAARAVGRHGMARIELELEGAAS